MSSSVYSKDELRYFRLAKGVINYTTAALRSVFIHEWNYLYPTTPWRNDGSSGLQMLAEERRPLRYSRLYDPQFENDYQAIKDHLKRGDVEDWDVTVLVFALLHSHALGGIRNDGHFWRKVKNAIHEIKSVRNVVLSHARKASIQRSTFLRVFGDLERAVGDLLTRTDPLVEKLKALRTEKEFVTDEVIRYKKLLQEEHNALLLLDKSIERLEYKMNIPAPTRDDKSNSETPKNRDIISTCGRRIRRLQCKLSSDAVDLVPSRFNLSILHSARYVRLINTSSSLFYNFCWEELGRFLKEFNDDTDMEIFAGIQAALALSHQSKKHESFQALNSLIPKTLFAKQCGVLLQARIKIKMAYILHDFGGDDNAWKEADDAEMCLSLGDCNENNAEINYAKANIILSSGKNSKEDRKRILGHIEKSIRHCEKANVDKSATVVQAKLRTALVHLGYYQHGILEEAPEYSDINRAETLLRDIANQSEPLTERSKVYLMLGQSLLSFWRGDINMAIKLENKVRRKCERHHIMFEIEQLDMLKTLIRSVCEI